MPNRPKGTLLGLHKYITKINLKKHNDCFVRAEQSVGLPSCHNKRASHVLHKTAPCISQILLQQTSPQPFMKPPPPTSTTPVPPTRMPQPRALNPTHQAHLSPLDSTHARNIRNRSQLKSGTSAWVTWDLTSYRKQHSALQV